MTHGPYRWVRHPNYVAVFLELLALPLIHSAWLTALLGGVAHLWVLRQRIATEESDPDGAPDLPTRDGDKAALPPEVAQWLMC